MQLSVACRGDWTVEDALVYIKWSQQGSADPSCKGLDSTYFRPYRVYGLCYNGFTSCCRGKRARDRMRKNRRGWMPLKLYFQAGEMAQRVRDSPPGLTPDQSLGPTR